MGRLALGGSPGERATQRPQRFLSKFGNLAYNSGATSILQCPQTDYTTQVDLIGALTVTNGATAPTGPQVGAAPLNAYSHYGNIQVKVNGGRAPFSMPGWHANVYSQIWRHDYVDSLASAPNTVSVTNTFVNPLRIPLTLDPITEKASWYTGDTQLFLTLNLTWNPISVMFGTPQTSTAGGSTDLYREYFAAPAPDEPDGWLNEISYYRQCELYTTQQLSNGTTNINLEVDQDYVRILLIFYTGSFAAATAAVADGLYTNLSLIANDKFRLLDTVAEQKLRFEALQTYARLLPAGSAVLDFMRLEPPSRRDILPTDANATKRLVLQILSTSSNNFVDVITEGMMDSQFAERWVRSAQQRSGTPR